MRQALLVVSRITAAVLGGYGFTALAVALLAVLLTRIGVLRSEAIVSAAMTGFLFYAVVLIWGFSVLKLRTLIGGLLAGSSAAYSLLLLAQ